MIFIAFFEIIKILLSNLLLFQNMFLEKFSNNFDLKNPLSIWSKKPVGTNCPGPGSGEG